MTTNSATSDTNPSEPSHRGAESSPTIVDQLSAHSIADLGLALLRTTEAAALAATHWAGRGDKDAGDQAAVDAMRAALAIVPMRGRIVIGEGEKDEAPMLANGELVGTGGGPEVDIAVDPVDGTTLLAQGRPNAIAVLAAAPGGVMLDVTTSWYMEKLVVGPELVGVVDIRKPIEDNIAAAVHHTGRTPQELTVSVLDRPRHSQLVHRIQAAGARVSLFSDGDVAAGLAAATPGTAVDMLVGVGGSPEGVITACAVKAVGGRMQARLGAQGRPDGAHVGSPVSPRILTEAELVPAEDVLFVATGITGGDLVGEVTTSAGGAVTHSLVLGSRDLSVRRIRTHHLSPHRR